MSTFMIYAAPKAPADKCPLIDLSKISHMEKLASVYEVVETLSGIFGGENAQVIANLDSEEYKIGKEVHEYKRQPFPRESLYTQDEVLEAGCFRIDDETDAKDFKRITRFLSKGMVEQMSGEDVECHRLDREGFKAAHISLFARSRKLSIMSDEMTSKEGFDPMSKVAISHAREHLLLLSAMVAISTILMDEDTEYWWISWAGCADRG